DDTRERRRERAALGAELEQALEGGSGGRNTQVRENQTARDCGANRAHGGLGVGEVPPEGHGGGGKQETPQARGPARAGEPGRRAKRRPEWWSTATWSTPESTCSTGSSIVASARSGVFSSRSIA